MATKSKVKISVLQKSDRSKFGKIRSPNRIRGCFCPAVNSAKIYIRAL
jgi:hypothetical protein